MTMGAFVLDGETDANSLPRVRGRCGLRTVDAWRSTNLGECRQTRFMGRGVRNGMGKRRQSEVEDISEVGTGGGEGTRRLWSEFRDSRTCGSLP